MAAPTNKQSSAIVRTVFLALILDLLAFTLPLPLFPRLIDSYASAESNDPTSLLSRTLGFFRYARSLATRTSGEGRYSRTLAEGTGLSGGNKRWDVVLLGGALGSVFSLCQCLISPFLGALSDKYGRKPILLITMIGNILSAFVWFKSTTFATYLISRLIGGLSEGNVQLSQAIIADVTTPETRSKGLALVGIAFSFCFTFGPSIGAYFASRPLPIHPTTSVSTSTPPSDSNPNAKSTNIYAFPALVSLILLTIETAFLLFRLPETKGWASAHKLELEREGKKDPAEQAREGTGGRESVKLRRERLRKLGWVHGGFLLFFSGAEFTLTFLTYDLFFATNKQNGMLLSYIGVLSSLLQGGYVRPRLSKHKTPELTFTQQGIVSCTFSLILMAILPLPAIRDSGYSTWLLYAIATGLSYTSATVVTGLMGAAAGCCDEDGEVGVKGEERLTRGKALGRFRSAGQLGRAIGPLLATGTYWTRGPSVTYTAGAIALGTVGIMMGGMVKEEAKRKALAKSK